MKKNTFVELASAFFILLFVYTALSKLYNMNAFRWPLMSSPVTSWATEFLVWAVPLSELIIAFLLFFPASRKWGLYSTAILMSIFTLYIAAMKLFTTHLPCSCGGIVAKMTWTQHLIFNSISVILAVAALKAIDAKNMQARSSGQVQYS